MFILVLMIIHYNDTCHLTNIEHISISQQQSGKAEGGPGRQPSVLVQIHDNINTNDNTTIITNDSNNDNNHDNNHDISNNDNTTINNDVNI